MPTPSTVIFDLDGTLVDTAPDLAGSVNVLLKRIGREPIDSAHIRPIISGGGRAMMARGLEMTGGPVTEAELDDLFEQFIEHYAAHISAKSRPFPGVITALEQLRARGARLAVCTNKRVSLAGKLLDELDMSRHFDFLAGGDSFPGIMKPDGRHVLSTIEKLGGDPAKAVMVGDSQADIGAAQAAKVPVVAVSFGYSDPPVETFNPDRLIDDFDELLPVMTELLGG